MQAERDRKLDTILDSMLTPNSIAAMDKVEVTDRYLTTISLLHDPWVAFVFALSTFCTVAP